MIYELRHVPLRARSKSDPQFGLSLGVLAQLTRDLRRCGVMPIDLINLMVPMVALAAWIMPSGRPRTYWPAAKALLVSFFEWFGELGIFCGRLVKAALVPPFEGRELIRQMDAVGSKSLPLV